MHSAALCIHVQCMDVLTCTAHCHRLQVYVGAASFGREVKAAGCI
jgi:hypothetical protein